MAAIRHQFGIHSGASFGQLFLQDGQLAVPVQEIILADAEEDRQIIEFADDGVILDEAGDIGAAITKPRLASSSPSQNCARTMYSLAVPPDISTVRGHGPSPSFSG